MATESKAEFEYELLENDTYAVTILTVTENLVGRFNAIMIHHHVIFELITQTLRNGHFSDRLRAADNDQICHLVFSSCL